MAQVTTTTLQNPNFLQPTGYKVVINRQRFANIEFFANSISHPSVNMPAAVQPARRANVYHPGDKLEFGELLINAIIDENMYVYQEIYSWMSALTQNTITPIDLRNASFDRSEYDISVLIMNSANLPVRKIVYKNAFPTDIGTIEFTSNSTSVEPIQMPISFRYDTFEFTDVI